MPGHNHGKCLGLPASLGGQPRLAIAAPLAGAFALGLVLLGCTAGGDSDSEPDPELLAEERESVDERGPEACLDVEDDRVCDAIAECIWFEPGCGEDREPGCFPGSSCGEDAEGCPSGFECEEPMWTACADASCDACGASGPLCVPEDDEAPRDPEDGDEDADDGDESSGDSEDSESPGEACLDIEEQETCDERPGCEYLFPGCSAGKDPAPRGCYPSQECSPKEDDACPGELACSAVDVDPCADEICDACSAVVNRCVEPVTIE